MDRRSRPRARAPQARKFTPSFPTSTGTAPTACTASMDTRMLRGLQYFTTFSMSILWPVEYSTRLRATSLVFPSTKSGSLPVSIKSSEFDGRYLTLTPMSLRFCQGATVAGFSQKPVTTLSPFFHGIERAMRERAIEVLWANAILRGLAPISSAASLLVSSLTDSQEAGMPLMLRVRHFSSLTP